MSDTFKIPEVNFEWFKHKIGMLNRKATKLNVQPIQVNVIETSTERWEEDGVMRARTFHTVEVVGETPKFAGWQFAAVLEWTGEANIIRKSPTVNVELSEFRNSHPQCNHCKASRNRKETFVMLHEDGSKIQLGRQCIKDFLGHDNPKMLAQWAEMLFSVADIGEEARDRDVSFGSTPDEHDTQEFLNHCAEWHLREGFKTRKQVEGTTEASTSKLAMMSMYPDNKEFRDHLSAIGWSISDKAIEIATKARERAMEFPAISDFENNLKLLANSISFKGKNAGMVAYIIGGYIRWQIDQVQAEAKITANSKYEHWGVVGQRVRDTELTYMGMASFESQFGVTSIYRFIIKDGETCYNLVWKTGRGLDTDVEPGDIVKATFTIKEHGEYNGRHQTVITRVVASSVTKAEEHQYKTVPF